MCKQNVVRPVGIIQVLVNIDNRFGTAFWRALAACGNQDAKRR